MCVIIFFRSSVSATKISVKVLRIETKQCCMLQSNRNQTELFSDQQSTAERMCVFGRRVEKEKCCLGPGDIKTVTTFLLYNFLIQNLAGYFVTAIATISVIYNFSHCWNRRNKLSKSTNRQSTLVLGCFSLQKK